MYKDFFFFKENKFKRKSMRYSDLNLTIFLYIQLELHRKTDLLGR